MSNNLSEETCRICVCVESHQPFEVYFAEMHDMAYVLGTAIKKTSLLTMH